MAISLEHTITDIKRYFTPEGFYLEKDQQRLLVDRIKQVNERSLFQDYPNYGIAFFSPEVEEDGLGKGIAFPKEEVYVEKGDSILAIGYSPNAEEAIYSEGVVLDVDESQEALTFTVQVEPNFSSKLYSVFLIDKIHSALNLVGIFSFSLGRVVHVAGFDESMRGPDIVVKSQCGKFRGDEDGNRGGGPRWIWISHSDLPQKPYYSLKFVAGKKRLNPHHDHSYTQDNANKEELYQTALDTFVDQYKMEGVIPKKFSFLCYKKKSEYEAILE